MKQSTKILFLTIFATMPMVAMRRVSSVLKGAKYNPVAALAVRCLQTEPKNQQNQHAQHVQSDGSNQHSNHEKQYNKNWFKGLGCGLVAGLSTHLLSSDLTTPKEDLNEAAKTQSRTQADTNAVEDSNVVLLVEYDDIATLLDQNEIEKIKELLQPGKGKEITITPEEYVDIACKLLSKDVIAQQTLFPLVLPKTSIAIFLRLCFKEKTISVQQVDQIVQICKNLDSHAKPMKFYSLTLLILFAAKNSCADDFNDYIQTHFTELKNAGLLESLTFSQFQECLNFVVGANQGDDEKWLINIFNMHIQHDLVEPITMDNYHFICRLAQKYKLDSTLAEQCMQMHQQNLDASIQKIIEVSEFSDKQKSEIISVITKIFELYFTNFKLLTFSLAELRYAQIETISDALLLQYFPLGIWLKKISLYGRENFFTWDEIALSKQLDHFLKTRKEKENYSYSEQIFLNNLNNSATVLRQLSPSSFSINSGLRTGINALVGGSPAQEAESRYLYYKTGFFGNLHKHGILQKVADLERQFPQSSYTTFVHGRAWEWNFLNDIWNLICDVKFGQKHYDRISLRQRDPAQADLDKLQLWRGELVTNGASDHIGSGTKTAWQESAHSEVTFMNLSPLSNNGYYGECTGTYILENHSIADKGAAFEKAQELIKKYNLQSHISDQDLQQLYQAHQQSSTLGETLCVIVKNEYVDQLVFPAQSGGLLNGKKPASEYIKEVKSKIAKTKKADNQRRFYCFAVSDIEGEYGTKYWIKPINNADSQRYAQYCQTRDALFAKVKQEMQGSV